jgi:hypothetical protein
MWQFFVMKAIDEIFMRIFPVCGLKNLEIGKETDIKKNRLNFICIFSHHNVYTNLDKDISALLPTSFFDFIMQTRRAHVLTKCSSWHIGGARFCHPRLYPRRKTMQNRKATGVEWFIKLLF